MTPPPRERSPAHAAIAFEHRVRADLHERRWVRLHVLLVGLVSFGVLWGLSHALWRAGIEAMAWRHAIALVGAYVVYLGLLWLWARWLLSREPADDALDLVDMGVPDGPWPTGRASEAPVLRSGGGGDFGGGGASGRFDGGSAGQGDGASQAWSAAADLGSADEGVVVAVPLALVVGAALLLGAALGFAVFGLFGVEVLMGAAVEIAFASAGGALAFKARREGWLGHVLRRTVRPMALVLAATVALGLAITYWLPQAATLPQALKLLFG